MADIWLYISLFIYCLHIFFIAKNVINSSESVYFLNSLNPKIVFYYCDFPFVKYSICHVNVKFNLAKISRINKYVNARSINQIVIKCHNENNLIEVYSILLDYYYSLLLFMIKKWITIFLLYTINQ